MKNDEFLKREPIRFIREYAKYYYKCKIIDDF